MSILDEIRKKRKSRMRTFCEIQTWINETSQSKNTEMLTAEDYVKLSDIEKILGEMKCEKCIHKDQDSACTFCQHLGIFFCDNPELKFCSQFEVKE